jgi:hypothetical protein
VGINGINRYSEHVTVLGLEIIKLPVEGQNLRGADKGKIKGIKENDYVFAPIGGKGNGFEAVIGHDSFSFKYRSLLGYQTHIGTSLMMLVCVV